MDLSLRIKSIPILAGQVGITRQHCWAVLTGAAQASGKLSIAIESACCGAITRSDLRPDLWPQSPPSLAESSLEGVDDPASLPATKAQPGPSILPGSPVPLAEAV